MTTPPNEEPVRETHRPAPQRPGPTPHNIKETDPRAAPASSPGEPPPAAQVSLTAGNRPTRSNRFASSWLFFAIFVIGGSLLVVLLILGISLATESGPFATDEEEDTDNGLPLTQQDEVVYMLGEIYATDTYTVLFPQGWLTVDGEDDPHRVLFVDPATLPDDVRAGESAIDALDEFLVDERDAIALTWEAVPATTSSPEDYLEQRRASGLPGVEFSEIDSRVLTGELPAASMQTVDEDTDNGSQLLLLAVELDGRIFIFSGYARPENTYHIMTLMEGMAATLAPV